MKINNVTNDDMNTIVKNKHDLLNLMGNNLPDYYTVISSVNGKSLPIIKLYV